MCGKGNESDRTDQHKGPGSPRGNDASTSEGDAEEDVSRQMTDDVDQGERAHRAVGGEAVPELYELRPASHLGHLESQIVLRREGRPRQPADQPETTADRGEPRRAPRSEAGEPDDARGQHERSENVHRDMQFVRDGISRGIGSDVRGTRADPAHSRIEKRSRD